MTQFLLLADLQAEKSNLLSVSYMLSAALETIAGILPSVCMDQVILQGVVQQWLKLFYCLRGDAQLAEYEAMRQHVFTFALATFQRD